MRRTNLLPIYMVCMLLAVSSCDTSQEDQITQQGPYGHFPEAGVEVAAVRNEQGMVTGYYYTHKPGDIIPKTRTEGYRITNRSDVIISTVGDMDNFGFGGNGLPLCIFYDLSDPVVDLGIFDKELGFGNEVQTWVHDFSDDPHFCENIRVDSVIVEIREYYSQDQSSTITIDGNTLPFISEPSLCNEPVIRSFIFIGEAASFALDGSITITFSENGDDIGLDWSRVYVVSSCEPLTVLDSDSDGIPDGNDNCPQVANETQDDNDADGAGDACDEDDDNDGVVDSSDNCPVLANAGQQDLDGDGQGDACDTDDDNDGTPDATDNCPTVPNIGQSNYDSDDEGDACDADDDNDGFEDSADVHPYSDLSATVVINGCDSGVENRMVGDGSKMLDLILDCKANSTNQGKFRACVTHLTNAWKASGLITTQERDSIKSCL